MVKFCICGKTNSNQSLTDVHEKNERGLQTEINSNPRESPLPSIQNR